MNKDKIKSYSLKHSLKSPEINYFIKNNRSINQSNDLQKQADFAKTRDHTIKFLINSYKILSENIKSGLQKFYDEETILHDIEKVVDDYAYPRLLQKYNTSQSRHFISGSLHLLATANNIAFSNNIQNLDNLIAESLVNIQEYVNETKTLLKLFARIEELPTKEYISLLAVVHFYEANVFAMTQLKLTNQKYYLNILEKQDLSL